MNKNLERLIGWQLVSIDDENIVLTKGGKTITLTLSGDCGDCCGYYEISTKLLIDVNDTRRNPIITKVQLIEEEGEYDGSVVKLVLFGEENRIAEIDTEAGSGSGWCYGACVTLTCEALNLNETLAQW